MISCASTLFKLIRIAIGNDTDRSISYDVDWYALVALATEQGVAALAYDGLQMCYEADSSLVLPLDRDQKKVKYDWFGSVLNTEVYYERHRQALYELVSLLANKGVKLMLLKGYGLSLNYPLPCHRPSGDIDFFCFGDYEKANAIARGMKLMIDEKHHKHSSFRFASQSVENHFSFLNVYAHHSTARIEFVLEDLIAREEMLAIDGFFIPSANFNALYILRHMAEHFASTGCTLRHLLDWALFCRSYCVDIDSKWFQRTIADVGMGHFLWLVNCLCDKYLGFPEETFAFAGDTSVYKLDDSLADRVMGDILSREFGEKVPKGFLPGVAFKYRRWRANGWKQSLVFPESRFRSFLTQTWSHLLKPATMRE